MNKIKELFKPLDLTNGRVWKVIVSFSIPILISYLFQQIYTIADAAICGQFLNENQVAGVNNTGKKSALCCRRILSERKRTPTDIFRFERG